MKTIKVDLNKMVYDISQECKLHESSNLLIAISPVPRTGLAQTC